MTKRTRLILVITALVIAVFSFFLLYSALMPIEKQTYQSTVSATLAITPEVR